MFIVVGFSMYTYNVIFYSYSFIALIFYLNIYGCQQYSKISTTNGLTSTRIKFLETPPKIGA
jgi:hypothetical protein